MRSDHAALAPSGGRRVDVPASWLRIADGLDPAPGVPGVLPCRKTAWWRSAQADGKVSGEVDAAMEKADLFERTFGVRLVFETMAASA